MSRLSTTNSSHYHMREDTELPTITAEVKESRGTNWLDYNIIFPGCVTHKVVFFGTVEQLTELKERLVP